MDAFGNVTESKAGNNRITWREHDDTTGMLKAITTQGGLQTWDYEFDGIGNLRSRSDHTHKLPALTGGSAVAFNESFEYDSLNRLKQIKNNGAVTQSLSYFANGSIKTKSDVHSGATYQYGTKPGQCGRNSGPRAVSQIGNTTYCYDVSGQQTQQYNNGTLVRQIDYDAIGKPSRIRSMGTDATTNSSPGDSFFTYDGSRNIVKRHVTEQGSTKTIFQHGGVELIREGSSTTIRRNIGNAIVELSGSRATTRYVYSDHLGSVDVITNAAGLLEQKLSFDAFGKRRQVFTQSNQPVALTLAAILNLTHRGFTGHLQVDHANVIHMGGRIYDAHIGRFLQADPFVQAPSNSQSHNRYSYVLNNPLSYTDPSGYFFSKLWKEIKPFIGVIVAIVGTYICGPQCGQLGYAMIGAASGAASAAVNGGSIIKGAVIGAFSAAAFGAVGETWAAGTFGNVMGNAVVGGFMSSLQGGKFGHGFLAAGFSAGFKRGINNIGGGAASHSAHRIVAAAVVGGTASKLSGGKFANGAITGAFSQAFNGEQSLRKMSLWDRIERDYSHEFLRDFESKNPYEYELFQAYASGVDATLWADGEIGYLMEADALIGFETFAVEKATLFWAEQIQAQAEGAIPGAIQGAAQDQIFKALGASQFLSKSVSNGQFIYSNSDMLRYTPEAIAISTSRSTSVINRSFVKEIYGK
ncbi:RHS repeat domain-containing protein [Rheinheimera sp. NSM]|uniref:RHS repeat domain-containing protein n=1 Tax=Rheinheimera sp. NSM TaxID=3457884 RepID=UPI0040368854